MFKKIGIGFKIALDSIKFLIQNPKTLFSILLFWANLLLFSGLGYLLLYLSDKNIQILSDVSAFLLVFIVFSMVSFSISIASITLIEMLKQFELDSNISIKLALYRTYRFHIWKSLPIILVWSIIILFIRVIQVIITTIIYLITSAFRLDFDFSLNISGSFFNLLTKGLRFYMMFVLPFIVWNNQSTIKAMYKAWKAIRTTWQEIIGAIIASNILTSIVILPVILIYFFFVNDSSNQDLLFMIFLILSCIVFSFSILIQQVYITNIFIWYNNWEDALIIAKANNELLPDIEEIERPSLLGDLSNSY